MVKKTQDQKDFEKFATKGKDLTVNFEGGSKNGMFCRNKLNGKYIAPWMEFSFQCWAESKRIQREQAQG